MFNASGVSLQVYANRLPLNQEGALGASISQWLAGVPHQPELSWRDALEEHAYAQGKSKSVILSLGEPSLISFLLQQQHLPHSRPDLCVKLASTCCSRPASRLHRRTQAMALRRLWLGQYVP